MSVESASGAGVGNARWYLVSTLAGREVLAAQQLERQAFATFLPRQLKTVRHARRVRITTAAFFPGYLFVHLDLGRDRWRSVNGTVGVGRLVGHGDRPTPVLAGVVEALMQAADDRGVISGVPLRPGQAVRITAGAFADQLGVIERLDGAGRVRVLLDIMNGTTPIDIRQELLSAAG